MASKSKTRPERKKGKPNQLAQLGLFDIPNLDALNGNDEDSEVDESALENELEALLGNNAPTRPQRPKPKATPVLDIEKLAADCLKDPDDMDDEDVDLSNDEELVNELQGLMTGYDEEPSSLLDQKPSSEFSPPKQEGNSISTVLQERLAMYNEAIAVAQQIGDTSKVRRYGRAVKTLQSLIKSSKCGSAINEEDIPPAVKIPKPERIPPITDSSAAVNQTKMDGSSQHTHPKEGEDSSVTGLNAAVNQTKVDDSSQQTHTKEAEDTSTISLLIARRDEYKKAALQAKRDGNKELALQFLWTVKTFNGVIEAIKNNQPVDLSNIPPPPSEAFLIMAAPKVSNTSERIAHDSHQTSADLEKMALAAAANDADQSEIFAAPPPPSTTLEALQQRLEKYSATKQAAEAEGNSSKARRLQRIVKQYETAIKDHKAGKNVDFEELPTPPGFAPIPLETKQPKVVSPKEKPDRKVTEANSGPNKLTKPVNQNSTNSGAKPQVSPKKPKMERTNTTSVSDKQLEFLMERQKLFRQAAISAKQNGDIQQAKEYLRMSKGFDSMIEATKCGLPIDASTIPTPPQLESDFVIVDVSECCANPDQSQEEVYETLDNDLRHQIEVCDRNKEHFFRLGDVSSASKFEKLALESKKDLAVIQNLRKKGESVPKFHYETRLFSVVQCHTDLNDNDLEVTIERGINLPVPKNLKKCANLRRCFLLGKPDELDSYVKVEFPIPSEAPQRSKTHTVRDTNNPVFQETFKYEINRKSRAQLRLFKRHALKLEVWSKGGFLRSDTHLGTVSVKLVDLESKCLVHDSFNLMDGRRASGGKLEVKLRIRNPLIVKQVEEVREKWLVVGS